MKLLFLDIDGVLNTHEVDPEVLCGRFLPSHVSHLNRVLRETDARIVLSSAWRYFVYRNEMNLAGLDWLLRSHGVIAGRLVGITREDTMVRPVTFCGNAAAWPMTNERGQQIADWRVNNGHTDAYAVVDDLDLGISESGHPFVQTDGKVGLTHHEACRLIQLLSP